MSKLIDRISGYFGLSGQSNKDWLSIQSLRLKLSTWVFSKNLGDYYLYLSDVLEGTQGKKSLLSVFQNDAIRHGTSARGILSAHWAQQFIEGGKLSKTFYGTLPTEDVAVIATLQLSGDENALRHGLRDLAQNKALIKKARSMLVVTLGASVLALALVAASVMVVPFIIVPQLIENFSMLPPEYYPETAKSLIEFSTFIQNWWAAVAIGFVGVLLLCNWSFGNMTGTVRKYFDKYAIAWGVHRDFQGMRFLSHLASMINQGAASKGLREAIEMQLLGSSKWKRHHIYKMIDMIDSGNVGPEIFMTGMFSKDMEYTMIDLIESRGIEDSLIFVKTKLEDRALAKLSIQASILSWLLMMLSLGVAISLMFWQVGAMDALTDALSSYLSN